MTQKKPPQSPIQVIDRAVALLDALNREGQSTSLKVLAAETGLHPSTAFRILAALQTHDLLARDESGQYRFGPRFLHYARQAQSHTDLRQEARAVMDQLRDQTGETVNLTVRQGDEVIYVERALSPRMMRVEQVIGSRAPLHVTAVGKFMLAESGDDACRSYARRTRLRRMTPNTLTTITELLREAQQIKKTGIAYDNEEAETGVACIGVLIRDNSGQAIAGLSISAPKERHQDEWKRLLQQAGAALSRRMGYTGS